MSAGAIVAWYNVINAGIRWLSGERGQSSHFWQDFQHIPSLPDTGGGPPCIQTMAPAWSSLEFYSIQLQGGDHLLVLTWKMKLHYISIVYLMACDLLIIMVAVGTMGVCFVWLYPPPPEYQPPTTISVQWVVTRSQGPGQGGLCGPQCIITGYSHNQPQLAFLSLSQHFVLLHRIKTCYANTIIDLIINPMSCCHHQCRCDTHLVSSFPSLEIIRLVIIMLMREAAQTWCDSQRWLDPILQTGDCQYNCQITLGIMSSIHP